MAITPSKGNKIMASEAMQREVDGYIGHFIAADKNNQAMRRNGGGNQKHVKKSQCGTRSTRGTKVVNDYTLTELFKRRHGDFDRAIA